MYKVLTQSEKKPISSVENQLDSLSIGDSFYWTREYAKARDHFDNLLENIPLTDSNLVRCYKSLAAAEVELKNYDGAINTYKKQLDILNGMNDFTNKTEYIMTCYLSIGRVYWLKCQYDKAVEYHHYAFNYTQSFPKHIYVIEKNLANIYASAKQFDQSLKYFKKTVDFDEQQQPKNDLQIGQTYANMGEMYRLQEKYREALYYFEKARQTLQKAIPVTNIAVEKVDNAIRNLSDILTMNNIMILWLDDHIGQDDNCRELKKQFRRITNSFKMFDSVESLRQCLPHIKDRKLFCIIQGRYAQEIVPDISSSMLEPVVYIFCLHMQRLNEWAQDQECIMRGGMFDHEQDLFDTLKANVKDYIRQNKTTANIKIPSEILDASLESIMKLLKDYCEQQKKYVAPGLPPIAV